MHPIFNSLLGGWKCYQTWSFVFDILPVLSEKHSHYEMPDFVRKTQQNHRWIQIMKYYRTCKGPQVFDWLFFNLLSPGYWSSRYTVYVSLRPAQKKQKTNTNKKEGKWVTAEQISWKAAWKPNVQGGERRDIWCHHEEQTEST